MATLSRILVGIVLVMFGAPWLCAASPQDVMRYFKIIAEDESRSNCDAESRNSSAIGCYQMTKAALIDAEFMDSEGNWLGKHGVYSPEDFRANKMANYEAALTYTQKNWDYLMYAGTDEQICTDFGDFTLDAASLLVGAHILGWRGVTWLLSCDLDSTCLSEDSVKENMPGDPDGWRDKIVQRMVEMAHAGLDVSELTGGYSWSCTTPVPAP